MLLWIHCILHHMTILLQQLVLLAKGLDELCVRDVCESQRSMWGNGFMQFFSFKRSKRHQSRLAQQSKHFSVTECFFPFLFDGPFGPPTAKHLFCFVLVILFLIELRTRVEMCVSMGVCMSM